MKQKSRLLLNMLGPKNSNVSPQRIPPPVYPSELPVDGQLSQQFFYDLFEGCADIRISKLKIGRDDPISEVILVSCDGMTNTQQINEVVIPRIMALGETDPKVPIDAAIDLELTRIEKIEQIVPKVFMGHLILYLTNQQAIYSYDASDMPGRAPEESNTELSIKGPRDGFVENVKTNVALVRKRLRTNALRYEQFVIGRKSESRVALLYIQSYIRPDLLEEARKRILRIDQDALLSSAQLEAIISDSAYSLFPLITYTGRPDFVVECLLRGRLAIIVDGAPIAIIAPVNLTLLLKSPEDQYFPAHIIGFQMSIRLLGLFIALFLPGFWIALSSYNMEQLPFPLLATVVNTRIGLPMPAPLEAFMMLALFEVFREAGVRLPKAVGQTIAVVGGIIVGDAVIRAGLSSTTMLIIAALTAVSTFTLVNQTLSASVTIIRFFVMAFASLLGMYGFILSVIAVVMYLSKLESFGIPYLTPLSPLRQQHLIPAFFKRQSREQYDTSFLHDRNNDRQSEQS